MSRFVAIALVTFREAVRQPVYVVLLLGVALAMAMTPPLTAFAFGQEDSLLFHMGLSTILLGGVLLAGFSAANVLAREIDNKTVLTVMSKPVSRPAYVLAKYAGLLAAVGVAFWVWSLVFLLTLRHGVVATGADEVDMPVLVFGIGFAALALLVAVAGNYLYRWAFPAMVTGGLAVGMFAAWVIVLFINQSWQVQPPGTDLHPQVMAALWFVLLALVVVAGVALAASTRAGQVLTLLICAGVLMLGLLSDPVLGRYVGLYQERSAIAVSDVDTVTFDERAAEEPQRPSNDRPPPPPAARAAGHVGYALVPNFQIFWLGDAVTQQRPVTFGYLLQVTAYALAYLTALLALAVALFQMRDAS